MIHRARNQGISLFPGKMLLFSIWERCPIWEGTLGLFSKLGMTWIPSITRPDSIVIIHLAYNEAMQELSKTFFRSTGRAPDALRPLSLKPDYVAVAEGSILI